MGRAELFRWEDPVNCIAEVVGTGGTVDRGIRMEY
jgi:hypothetical protein